MNTPKQNSTILSVGLDDLPFSDFQQRLRWYVRLRWLAAAIILLVVLVFGFLLPIITEPYAALSVVLALLLFNILFFLYKQRLQNIRHDPGWLSRATIFSHVQTVVDLLCIAMLIHLTGGAENPFAIFFVFHVIIASLLLDEHTSIAYTGLAAILYSLIVWGEFFHLGPLRHHQLNFEYYLPHSANLELWKNPMYVFAATAAITTSVFASNYVARWVARLLHHREQQLEQAYQDLSASIQGRTEYLLQVTHELRSPLATIRNCLALSLQPPAGTSAQKQTQMLDRAYKRTNSLLDLVNDLLDLARVQSGQCKTEAEQVDLALLIYDACSSIQPRTDSKNQKLITDLPPNVPTIYACRHLLGQMIMNLLGNAHKYTPPGGTITVRCRQKRRRITIQVSDSGIGISKEDLPNVFDDFFRGKQARKVSDSGTGLGLSIVHRAVEQCNGSIKIRPNSPQGTTITLRLPITQPQDP